MNNIITGIQNLALKSAYFSVFNLSRSWICPMLHTVPSNMSHWRSFLLHIAMSGLFAPSLETTSTCRVKFHSTVTSLVSTQHWVVVLCTNVSFRLLRLLRYWWFQVYHHYYYYYYYYYYYCYYYYVITQWHIDHSTQFIAVSFVIGLTGKVSRERVSISGQSCRMPRSIIYWHPLWNSRSNYIND